MKRKSKRVTGRKKRHTKKNGVWKIFSIFVIAFLAVISLATYQLATNSSRAGLKIASNNPKNSLQIETFKIIPRSKPSSTPRPTLKPAPSNLCNHHDDGVAVDPTCICTMYLVHCENKQCKEVDMSKSMGKPPFTCAGTHSPWVNWCDNPATSTTDGWFCLGKPVIYLYPEKPMYVDVEIQTTGQIVVSDPLYPKNGWKKVWAEPNGKLTYQGKNYSELFYESNVADFEKPKNGITLDSKNIRADLDILISKLGLIKDEKTEFLDWWVPRLQALNSPYILFSVIEKSEKEKIDHVVYTPEPDTRIEFIAYFKPLLKPFEGKPLELPSTPPQRIGFTAVEWGGTIDYEN